MIKSETPRPQAKTTMKSIEWLDGDISHSQKKCPSSIMKLIGKHLAEFEASVAATIWPKSKTCYIDKGRDIQYVDAETDQEIPVARYTYGGGQQFFVVWLPPKDPNEVPRPAISKVRVYNNDGPKIRNGKSWKPVMWRTVSLKRDTQKGCTNHGSGFHMVFTIEHGTSFDT